MKRMASMPSLSQQQRKSRQKRKIGSPLELCPHSKPAGSQVLFDTDNEEQSDEVTSFNKKTKKIFEVE